MITAIGDVMRQAYQRGWITTRDGNISVRRRDHNVLYITPSGVRKNIIHPESIVRIPINDEGELSLPDDARPSGELEMHRLLQLERGITRAVVHLHPTNIVAAIFAGWDLQEVAAHFPEVNRYTRVGPTVPVLPAVSKDLAIATYESLNDPMGNRKFDIVGQANHGVCAVSGDPWSAYEHIERLDHICEIVLRSGVRPNS
jgi:L-fuculose-phosphate aldolase